MNRYLKEFLHRGLMFGGLGPIVTSIVYICIEYFNGTFSLSASELCLAVISTYFLAFIQAGVSVFNQIEHWPLPKSLLCHFGLLYITYILCYVINTWIPFSMNVILIFTAIFVVTYFIIWICVYFSIKVISAEMNKKLN